MNEIVFPAINLKLNINPIMFSIFGINIYWYGFLIVFGMALGMILCKKNDGKFGIKFDDILELFIVTIPISIICARLYYVAFKLDSFIQDPIKIFSIRDGGLAIYGGIIGALITVIIFCKKKHISILNMIDFVVPYLALGQCIGRWGNFFNVEAHGFETNSIFRMGIIENGSYIEVHPTFLYESAGTFLIFLVLKIMQKNRKYDGQIMYVYLALYSFIRTFIEGLRTDSLMIFNFRVSQILSIVLFIFSISMMIYKFAKNKNYRPNLHLNNEKEENKKNNNDNTNNEEVKNMLEEVEVLCHSSIRLTLNNKTIYIDPYCIENVEKNADIVFITHDHYDHFSIEDINKIKNESTIFVMPETMVESAKQKGIEEQNIVKVVPNANYEIGELKIETVPAYNENKKFHPKENLWVGYIIESNNVKYYIAGDTDITEENKKVKCDVALVPIGGTYTMNYEDAVNLVNIIKPKYAIPTHYGKIVGNKEDGEKFKKLVDEKIECVLKIR